MNNLYNSLMAYRQRGGAGRGPQMPRQMGRPMGGQQPTGGYDSSGINPGGGMPRPPQARPMQAMAPQMPPMQAPAPPPMQSQAPQMGGGMPATQAPAGGGYDSSGINPSAGRPFQLQGGFSAPVPQGNNPILIHNKPATF